MRHPCATNRFNTEAEWVDIEALLGQASINTPQIDTPPVWTLPSSQCLEGIHPVANVTCTLSVQVLVVLSMGNEMARWAGSRGRAIALCRGLTGDGLLG